LLQQQPDGSAAAHAVTAPSIKALQQVWAESEAEWSGKLHGFPRIA